MVNTLKVWHTVTFAFNTHLDIYHQLTKQAQQFDNNSVLLKERIIVIYSHNIYEQQSKCAIHREFRV